MMHDYMMHDVQRILELWSRVFAQRSIGDLVVALCWVHARVVQLDTTYMGADYNLLSGYIGVDSTDWQITHKH